ncbi:phospholipase A and acyltransferase 4 isoform X1 [Equus caballus]|uniref:phospholipase A and acyltransferase 4 isoform X1 n=2 Tax=Equus caballus TaxID=9796 RepID=UPI0038B2EA08
MSSRSPEGQNTMVQGYEDLEAGDLMEIFHTGDEHWAIYVGGGDVLHLDPISECPRADSSSTYSSGNIRAVVKQEHVRYAVGSCLYRVNNYLDQVYRPRPVNEIISSAREMIGAQLEYCVKDRKYKHFVTHLRYGTACSRQFCKEPEPGDLINIYNIISKHWAIYVGGGDVIHLAPLSEDSEAGSSSISILSRRAVVKQERLQDVVNGYHYQVDNYWDQ